MSWKEFFKLTRAKIIIVLLIFFVSSLILIPSKAYIPKFWQSQPLFMIYYIYFLFAFSVHFGYSPLPFFFLLVAHIFITYLIVSAIFYLWVYSKIVRIKKILTIIAILIFFVAAYTFLAFNDIKDVHYQKIGEAGLNINMCDEISNEFRKESCYRYIINKKVSPDFCESIEYEPSRDECFIILISREGSKIEYCFQMRIDDRRWSCLEEIAVSQKNPSLCENIETESRKKVA